MKTNTQSQPILEQTHFSWLDTPYEGKVRDTYTYQNLRILIATDRLSAFDKILTTVPFKGQVLTQLAAFWFSQIEGVVPHHVVAIPDPNVMIVRDLSIVPIEVIVRGYLAGSAWRDYSAGRSVSGITLNPGLKEFAKLDRPIITPSTKAGQGEHDIPISSQEIVERKIASKEVWDEISKYALTLFEKVSNDLEQRGLLLADTKYEFGLSHGKVVLADEIHTLDSSRFWIAESYQDRCARGEVPEMLDKEPIRRWLMQQKFSGEGKIPEIPLEKITEWQKLYIDSYKKITGQELILNEEEPLSRIEKNLKNYLNILP